MIKYIYSIYSKKKQKQKKTKLKRAEVGRGRKEEEREIQLNLHLALVVFVLVPKKEKKTTKDFLKICISVSCMFHICVVRNLIFFVFVVFFLHFA